MSGIIGKSGITGKSILGISIITDIFSNYWIKLFIKDSAYTMFIKYIYGYIMQDCKYI
jgi:hypothetical protein